MPERASDDPDRLQDVLSYLGYTFRRFYADGLTQAAGALTYSTLLALVPLLVIAFAIFSAFPAFEAVQEQLQTLIFANLLPETSEDLRGYLERFTVNATNLTAVGIVALVVSAVLLLSTVEATLNKVWRVERSRPLATRLLVFWTLLTLGPLLLGASFTVSSDLISRIGALAGGRVQVGPSPWFQMPLAALTQAIVFTALFKLVPARPVRLRDAAMGGAISGIAFELLKFGFQAYLGSGSTYQTIYGALAAFPVFLIWTYASWTVIILGAVFAASLPDWRRRREPGTEETLGPSETLAAAVLVLGVLARKAAREGGTLPHAALAEEIPLAARDSLIEGLVTAGYLIETDQDRIALVRDLHVTTLADLSRDLGLALGRRGADESAPAALAPLLDRLAGAEDEILGRPVAEVIASGRRSGAAAPVPLSTAR